ncbi:MAG: membrane protein insertion efficiency factor YidD [Hyphomicrobiaceae bacterium]
MTVKVRSKGRQNMHYGCSRFARWCLKFPIYAYRWTVRPWFGWHCRHVPTCSDYALEAIELNGAWRGFWLVIARLSRCQPWGTAGHEPVPDIRGEFFRWCPWKYGRWSGRGIVSRWTET